MPSSHGEDAAPGARLRDVAALAKVSTSTASRALSGDPRISVTTRRRVERAATRLAYRANPMARGLSMRRSFTVGLIVGDLANPFFAQLARGVDEALNAFGYTYLLADMDGDPARLQLLAPRMVDRHVDGLLVTFLDDLSGLEALPVPLVAVGRCPGIPSVSSDNVAGGRLAAEHLVEAGYRRIAVLHSGPQWAPVVDRRLGFRQGLDGAGVGLPAELDRAAPSPGYNDAFAAALDLLRARPDAVFAINDLMAAAVVAAAVELGLSVPGDVGVVGYNDTPMAGWRTLSLTSVDQRTVEMGRAAGSMILRRIEHPDEDPASLILEPRLVVRDSSAGPRR